MAHASGYSFNATVDFVRVMSHKVLHTTFFMLYQFLNNVLGTLEAYSVNVDLSILQYTLEFHMQIQMEAINKVYQSYNYNKD